MIAGFLFFWEEGKGDEGLISDVEVLVNCSWSFLNRNRKYQILTVLSQSHACSQTSCLSLSLLFPLLLQIYLAALCALLILVVMMLTSMSEVVFILLDLWCS